MNRQTKINVLTLVLYGAVLYGYFFLIINPYFDGRDHQGLQVSLGLIVSSFGLGIAAQLIFDWHNKRAFLFVFKWACLAIFGLLSLLLIISFETIICIVIGGPILILMMAVGLYVIRIILKTIAQSSALCMPLLALPFLTPLADVSSLIPSKTYSVSTSIEMQGTPTDIRALAISVPLISDTERPWTLTHSILRAPKPLQAQTLNEVRYATWQRGVAFEEVLIDTNDDNTLAWSFRFPDPKLLKPLDYRVSPIGPDVYMETGGYRFDAIDENRTLVTLTTTYRLETPINGYLAFWGKVFLDDFHMAVLHVIAQRAETQAAL
jgi:hypothetical protein